GCVHHSIDNDRRCFEAASCVCVVVPGEAEVPDIIFVDLCEWRVVAISDVAPAREPLIGLLVGVCQALRLDLAAPPPGRRLGGARMHLETGKQESRRDRDKGEPGFRLHKHLELLKANARIQFDGYTTHGESMLYGTPINTARTC